MWSDVNDFGVLQHPAQELLHCLMTTAASRGTDRVVLRRTSVLTTLYVLASCGKKRCSCALQHILYNSSFSNLCMFTVVRGITTFF